MNQILQDILFHRYRLTLGHQTVVFDKENDPTQLRATAPGKLLNYVVDDGQHLNIDEPYVEIEVF